MDGMHLLYRPRNVDPEDLERALFSCLRRAWSPGRVLRRMARGARSGFWGGIANATANLAYRSFQTSLARAGAERVEARGPWPGPPWAVPTRPAPGMESPLPSQEPA
jgi:hypothetical protein